MTLTCRIASGEIEAGGFDDVDRWPKQSCWTMIESWFERPSDVIEFAIRRLPAAD